MTTATTILDINGNPIADEAWVVSVETGTSADFGQLLGDRIAWQAGACQTLAKYESGQLQVCEDYATADALWEERRAS
jgi:hypothetical protein